MRPLHAGGVGRVGSQPIEVVYGVASHVAKVTERVHRLVVAVQSDDSAARCLRFPCQLLEEIEDLLLTPAAFQLVAGLHQNQVAAGPMSVRAERTGQSEDLLSRLEVARSEERRVGKECRSRWWPCQVK